MTAVIELQKLREGMEYNGYAHFDYEAFEKNLHSPCYIPENAEELDEAYSRRDLKREVQEFLKNYPEYEEEQAWAGESHEDFVEALVIQLMEELEWQFPSTLLEEWNY